MEYFKIFWNIFIDYAINVALLFTNEAANILKYSRIL